MSSNIALRYPIVSIGNGAEISSVTLRRPKVKDIAVAERTRGADGEFAAGVALLSAVSGLSTEQIDELDAADFIVLSKEVEGFMSRRKPATGGSTPRT